VLATLVKTWSPAGSPLIQDLGYWKENPLASLVYVADSNEVLIPTGAAGAAGVDAGGVLEGGAGGGVVGAAGAAGVAGFGAAAGAHAVASTANDRIITVTMSNALFLNTINLPLNLIFLIDNEFR